MISNALKPTQTYTARDPTSMENMVFQIKQMMSPRARTANFLSREPFNGKSMQTKKTLKTTNAWKISSATRRK
jgi:hypothetical protein